MEPNPAFEMFHKKVKDKDGIKDPKSPHCYIIPSLLLFALLQIFSHLAHGKSYD
jgi:hypothetical protein